MLIRQLFVICAASLTTLPFTATKAHADALSDFYSRGAVAASQAQWQRWNSYTPRQKQLATAVGQISHAYYQKYGRPLPVTNQTLRLIMNALGATPQEAAFIQDRMIANSNAQAAIPKADAVINRTQNFLNCLNTRGTGCIP